MTKAKILETTRSLGIYLNEILSLLVVETLPVSMDVVRMYPRRRSLGVLGKEDARGSRPYGSSRRPELGFHLGVAWADVVRRLILWRGKPRHWLNSLCSPRTGAGSATYFLSQALVKLSFILFLFFLVFVLDEGYVWSDGFKI
jgi:hypothetical protein